MALLMFAVDFSAIKQPPKNKSRLRPEKRPKNSNSFVMYMFTMKEFFLFKKMVIKLS